MNGEGDDDDNGKDGGEDDDGEDDDGEDGDGEDVDGHLIIGEPWQAVWDAAKHREDERSEP